jgi:predicted oxidoreductase
MDRIEFAVNATKLNLTTEDWFAIYSAALGHEVP